MKRAVIIVIAVLGVVPVATGLLAIISVRIRSSSARSCSNSSWCRS